MMMQLKSQLENILYHAALRVKYAQTWFKSTLPWLASAKEEQRAEIILHVGAPKTGTSAIQRFCLRNRLALLRAGFYYPEHGIDKNGVSGGHFLICQPGSSETVAGLGLLQKWLETAKKANLTLLLSSESFYVRSGLLWPSLQGKRVQVIGWYRHPIDSIVSNYNQSVKRNFSSHTLDHRCRSILKTQGLQSYDGQCLQDWANLIGEQNCTFYPFRYSASQPIESVLLNTIGLTSEQQRLFKIDKALINRSYAFDALELKRRLNKLLDKQDVTENRAIDLFLQRYSDQHAHAPSSYVHMIPAATMQLLNQRFAQSQAQLFERFPALAPIAEYAAMRDDAKDWQTVVGQSELQALWQEMAVALPEVTAMLLKRLHDMRQSAEQVKTLQEVIEVLDTEPALTETHAEKPLNERH